MLVNYVGANFLFGAAINLQKETSSFFLKRIFCHNFFLIRKKNHKLFFKNIYIAIKITITNYNFKETSENVSLKNNCNGCYEWEAKYYWCFLCFFYIVEVFYCMAIAKVSIILHFYHHCLLSSFLSSSSCTNNFDLFFLFLNFHWGSKFKLHHWNFLFLMQAYVIEINHNWNGCHRFGHCVY